MHEFTAGKVLTILNTETEVPVLTISLEGTTRMISAITVCTEMQEAHDRSPFGRPGKDYAKPQQPFAPLAPAMPARRFDGPKRDA